MKLTTMTLLLTIWFISAAMSASHAIKDGRRCSPCNCYPDKEYGGVLAICSGRSLRTVPNLPRKTTKLLLDNNALQYLPNNSFNHFPKLKYLDLSHNRLSVFDPCAFCGVELQNLILDDNVMPSCDFPVNLKPLSNLQTLSAVNCTPRECLNKVAKNHLYFHNAFPSASKNLYIDCLNCVFMHMLSPLLSMSRVSLLSFSSPQGKGKCYFQEIRKHTFALFSNLKTLNLSGCHINQLDPDAFSLLTNLSTIDLTSSHDLPDFFSIATQSLSDSIQTIRYKYFEAAIIDNSVFKFLKYISLTELHFDAEIKTVMKKGIYADLPKSLEILSLQNYLFTSSDIVIEIKLLSKLRRLDLSGAEVYTRDGYNLMYFTPSSFEIFICSNCMLFAFLLLDNAPNIREVVASSNKYEVLSDIVWYLETIERLDLSHNQLREIHPMFHPNNSLSHLVLSNNKLGRFFEKDNSNLYKRFKNLRLIDISSNSISSLPENFLQFFSALRVLNISDNLLTNFPVYLSPLSKLQTLDLSHNTLYNLPNSIRDDVDKLPNVSVRLHGNPLTCSCAEIDFLRWMMSHKDRIDRLEDLMCRFSDGTHEYMDHLDDIVHKLEDQCKSRIVEILVSVSVVVCVLTGVICFLGYRFRWKLRYLYHVGRRGYRRRHAQNKEDEDFQYDAFVSYADEDRRFVIDLMMPELETTRGLTLCIHHRDFLPGEVIATNIVNAIQNSRKTFIVLSPSFLSSTWCEYEYNMARMESVSRRHEIVLVVLYRQVAMRDLPKDMAVMFKRNCYLEFNDDQFGSKVFWGNVAESIKTVRHRE